MDTITVIRGDSASFDVTFRDKNDDLVDLTGCTVFFTVKEKLTDDDDDAIISKEVSSFEDPTTGVATILLDSGDVSVVGKFFYDVQLKDSLGNISSSAIGEFIVNRDITVRIS